MWIDNNLKLPTKAGKYSCLVDVDGLGNLAEIPNQFFNGTDWCDVESCKQYIRFWFANKTEYQKISNQISSELEDYLENKIQD